MPDVNHVDGLVGQAYSSVKLFNILAGNLQKDSGVPLKERLLNQVKIIQSKLDEFKKGAETDDPLETLDGAGDLFVTAVGALQMLDEISSAREALLEICSNNLTKYIPRNHPEAEKILNSTVQMYKDKGEDVKATLNLSFGVYVFKDSEGKVRKPFGYDSVNLTEFLVKPQGGL